MTFVLKRMLNMKTSQTCDLDIAIYVLSYPVFSSNLIEIDMVLHLNIIHQTSLLRCKSYSTQNTLENYKVLSAHNNYCYTALYLF